MAKQRQKKENPAEKLVELALPGTILFHDPTDQTFARIMVDDHAEILKLGEREKPARRWIAYEAYRTEKKIPSPESVSTALQTLEAMAVFEGQKCKLYNRVAFFGGNIWYDMTDEKWRAIQINATGWDIIKEPPIIFQRFNHQKAQMEPQRDGDIEKIFDFTCIESKNTRLLLLAYIVTCLVETIAHPIIVCHGSHGSGKSSLYSMLRKVIDPSVTPTIGFPQGKNDLIQTLHRHWMPLFDNLTSLKNSQSDDLCRTSTGAGFEKRALYTDSDAIIFEFRRCAAVNGINVVTSQPDLLDRSILIGLDRIPNDQRRTEQELWEVFDHAVPVIFGGALNILSEAMRVVHEIKLETLPRMADFAKWGCAVARVLGQSDEDFLAAYAGNSELQNREVFDSNPIATAIYSLIKGRDGVGKWEGTPSKLLSDLETRGKYLSLDTDDKYWPKAPNALMRRINAIKPNLRAAGIVINARHGAENIVTITQVEPDEKVQANEVPVNGNGKVSQDTTNVNDDIDGIDDNTFTSSPTLEPEPVMVRGEIEWDQVNVN